MESLRKVSQRKKRQFLFLKEKEKLCKKGNVITMYIRHGLAKNSSSRAVMTTAEY